MSLFTDAIASNPPRLVVMFRRDESGQEQYQWGVVGNIPILSLIGYLGKVENDLTAGTWIPDCDNEQPALVVVWDQSDNSLSHYVHPDIPAWGLAGMVEVIRQILVGSRVAQMTGVNKVQLYDAGGHPIGGPRF